MHLGLGTAQFGLDYGITNAQGRVPVPEVKRMLAAAAEAGISLLDTASGYGESEAVIGELKDLSAPFRIATKLPSLAGQTDLEGAKECWRESLKRSLRLLSRRSVDLLMAHDASDLLGGNGQELWRVLQDMKAGGQAKKIGISVYTASEIEELHDRFQVDAIQLPFNALDSRLVSSGHLEQLSAARIEVQARSVFLQGLLLSPGRPLPPFLAGLQSPLDAWSDNLAVRNLTPLQGALLAVRQRTEIDTLIFGAVSLKQLLEVSNAWTSIEQAPPLDLTPFALDDDQLLDPRRWPQTKLEAEA